ncbi:hypothetical protein N5I87_25390 [Ralstonia sp. CHL-2022]|uniref:Lipoprotein n=1 Tax=Ralstonia mojiangensis TaxID=2953895 RepID=A0AAE3I800_9RALS|nr:hypothetical protein [Ralstonia mojiangensis]MCT7319366.1 hypothetical protein [Ralstonia mojiangensis]
MKVFAMPWKTLGSLSVVLPLVVGCAMPAKQEAGASDFISHREEPQNRPSDKPVPVQGRTKKVTVFVLKDPSYEVWIGMRYSTRNDGCRSHSTASLVLGSPAISQAVRDMHRAPVGVSSAVFNLYLDQYEPGDCRWAPDGIEYAVFDPRLTPSPRAFNFAVKAAAGANTQVRLRSSCSVVPSDQTASRSQLRCMWNTPFSPQAYSVSLDGGVVELIFAPDQ